MRTRAVLAALAAVVLVSLAAVSSASARPSFNPVCMGAKIEGGESGTYAMTYGEEAGTITITVVDTLLGPEFSFDTGDPSHVVGQVDVKGGTSLLSFVFDGVTSASGLHADLNPSSGEWYGISYLCFHTTSLGGGEGEGGEGGGGTEGE